MASLILHQIIGEKYCNINNIDNPQKFLKGNIAPDIAPNKDTGQYKEPRPIFTYYDAAKDRVNLHTFCKSNKIDNDYNLGYFLHLVTDHIFYNILIADNPQFIEFCTKPYKQSSAQMYTEYDRVANYLLQLFPQTDLTILPKAAINTLNEKLQILDENKLIEFISICSNINLQQLYTEVINQDSSTLLKIKF